MENGVRIPFMQKQYSNDTDVYYIFGSNVEDPADLVFATYFDYITLPKGKYVFVIKDESMFIPEFDEIETSIGVHPDALIH